MAKTTKKGVSENAVIATIYDFPLKLNTLYEVQEKLDSSAPDGFIDYRTTKTLSAQIIDDYSAAVFDIDRDVWDTGLFSTSKAFRAAFSGSDEAIEAVFKNIEEHIIKPYEAEKGVGSLRYHTDNNKFWDNFSVKISRGKIFDTSKIDDLLRLYLCLIHKRLTPKEHESNPLFKQPVSNYLILDKEVAVSRKSEKAQNKMEAIASFYTLLKSDKDNLIRVLDYLGISAGVNTDEDTLITVFNNWIEDKQDRFQNDKLFVDAIEFRNTKKGEDVLYIHTELKKLHRQGKVKFKKGEVYLDDVYVENGWKNSANKIHGDKELFEIFTAMIE